ncbi:MAG: protein kinase [Kofleriaceae bacterium]
MALADGAGSEREIAAMAQTATLPAQARASGSDSGEAIGAGVQLGHFRIDQRLGAGGMGEVYLATDLALDRPVAIKVLPTGSATSGAARDRLIREARAQARIHHPNVAHIYFIGEDHGRVYFAMEHLAGKTLAERAAEGPLPVEEAIAAVRAAALGLREAQRSGFTHRDVKPSNLMADAHGVVKVLDFGLVGATPEAASGPVAQTSLAGTPLYMAPEQAKGQPIDLRGDIYALGATLFHLVSGRPPFLADTIDDLMSLHATAARPHVPKKGHARTAIAAIDGLIAKMMAPDPADRFATYDDLLRALELVSTQHSRPAGAWVRSVATSIDFILVGLVLAIAMIPFGGGGLDGNTAAAIVLACATFSVARWGTTAGKALLELEVVSVVSTPRREPAAHHRPTLTQAFVREVTMLGPMLATAILSHYFHLDGFFTLLGAGLTVIALFVSAWRTPGKRAPWDRASGTQVRYRAARRSSAALLP